MAKSEDNQAQSPEQADAQAPAPRAPRSRAGQTAPVGVQAHDFSAHETGRKLAAGPKRMISLAPVPANSPQVVPVIINGYRYEVQRGVDVEVPEPVAAILREAGYR